VGTWRPPAVLIVIALAFGAVPSQATTIVIYWSKADGVILAADSKTEVVGDGYQAGFVHCKITQPGGVVFAASGISGGKDSSGKTWVVYDLAELAFTVSGDLTTRTARLVDALRARMPGLVSASGETVGINFVVVGHESGQLVAHLVTYVLGKEAELEVWPRDLAPGDRSKLASFGFTTAANRFIKMHPRPATMVDAARILRRAIEAQADATPDAVGKPVDVLQIDTTGRAQWVERSEKSKCPPVK
jgi:hypothetical protein